MEIIKLALKPKYPTRGAIEEPLYNDDNFVDIVEIDNAKQARALMDTSFAAIYKDDKYYPINEENVFDQYELVQAGEDPTVEEDEKFGFKKLENFITAPDEEDAVKKIQMDVELYNGLAKGYLLKVFDYTTIGVEAINENGYWFAFNFDLAGAEEAGYSEVKLIDGTEVADGINYIKINEINARSIFFNAKFTTEDEAGESVTINKDCDIMNLLSEISVVIGTEDENAIEINGKVYTTLTAALNAVKNGETILISKSIEDEGGITLEDREITFYIRNNATVSLNACLIVKGGIINVIGEGTFIEKNPLNGPFALRNTDEEKQSFFNVSKGITLKGWAGIFVGGNARNININCEGNAIGMNNGYDGAGIYINGTAKNCTLYFSGSTEGTVGHGVFLSGDANSTIENAYIQGTEAGLEIRSGSIYVINSTFESLSESDPSMTPSGSGSTATAVAFAIAQHTTVNKINVTIESGKFIGKASFMEGNPQQTATATEDTTISIIDGIFITTGEETIKTLAPETDCVKFVKGGTYNVAPNEIYLANGYKVNQNKTGSYSVVKKNADDIWLDNRNIAKVEGEEYLYTADYPIVISGT